MMCIVQAAATWFVTTVVIAQIFVVPASLGRMNSQVSFSPTMQAEVQIQVILTIAKVIQ